MHQKMFQDFDNYLDQYSPNEDPCGQTWSDFAVHKAVEISQGFSSKDWEQLFSSLLTMPNWKKALLSNSAGYGDDVYAIDLLLLLTTSCEDPDTKEESIDVLAFRALRETSFRNVLKQRGISNAEKEAIAKYGSNHSENQSDEFKFISKFIEDS